MSVSESNKFVIPESILQLVVEPGNIRMRLEDYLFSKFPFLSRMYLRDVIRREKCQVNGRVENKGKRVSSGDFVEIELEMDRENAMRPESIPLDIVYEDDEIIAINKPAGMLVHPTHREKTGTLLNGLSFYLSRSSKGTSIRPGLVHRLDKGTSGLMLIAKDPKPHRALARQFQRKTVVKIYFAWVEGVPPANEGVIDAPIRRFAEDKRWGVSPDGSPSVTQYRLIKTSEDTALLELRPLTGRTNQLRIHCAYIGHPIIGDVTRGGRESGQLCLHANSLEFRHPADGRLMKLKAPAPNWLEI